MPPRNLTPTCESCKQVLPRSEFDRYPSGQLRHACRACDEPAARRRATPKWIIDDATGCWIWQKYTDRLGYGYVGIGGSGNIALAHRVVYEQFRGPIPDGLDLDHLCRNPSCVCPEHLEPVTHVENCRRGKQAILTLSQVEEIREATGLHREIAVQYGVSRPTVTAIKSGRNWKS